MLDGSHAAPTDSKPLLVSIPQARALLGARGASLSDDEVRRVILDLQTLAAAATASYAVQNRNKHIYNQEANER